LEIENRKLKIPRCSAFAFVQEALEASGIRTDRDIRVCMGKLDVLQRGLPEFPDSARGKAETLFRWLWKDRPHRYMRGGSFRLNEVISSQSDPQSRSAGNCLGLTLIFNSLAKRVGLDVAAIKMELAFGTGPHVLSLVYAAEGPLQVENILPEGFDYRAHGKETQVIWDDKALVADIYNSRGTESFLKGDMETALSCYEKALSLNPGNEKARLNMGLTLAQLGREKEAQKAFNCEL